MQIGAPLRTGHEHLSVPAESSADSLAYKSKMALAPDASIGSVTWTSPAVGVGRAKVVAGVARRLVGNLTLPAKDRLRD